MKITGCQKPRSVEQLGLFMACCELVSENTEDPMWSTKDNVKFQVKVGLHFVDDSVVAVRPDGVVQFQYRSIGFESLKHMEACNFFDRAFPLLASKIGIDTDTMIAHAQEKMQKVSKWTK